MFARQLPESVTAEVIMGQVAEGNDFTLKSIYARAGKLKGSTGYWMQERNNHNCVMLYLLFFFDKTCVEHARAHAHAHTRRHELGLYHFGGR